MTFPQVDEPRLETDTAYRFGYLCEFIGFGADDIDAIHAAAAFLGPRVPGLVDAVYDKLFAYDATKRHLVPRQSGYEGPLPEGIDDAPSTTRSSPSASSTSAATSPDSSPTRTMRGLSSTLIWLERFTRLRPAAGTSTCRWCR